MSNEDEFPKLLASPLETSLKDVITYRDNKKVDVYVLEIYPSERFHLEAAIQYHFIAKLIENGYDVLVVWRDSNLDPFFLSQVEPSSSPVPMLDRWKKMLDRWKNSLHVFLHCLKLPHSKIKFLNAMRVWTDLTSPNQGKTYPQNILMLTLMLNVKAVSDEAEKSLEKNHYHCDSIGRKMTPDKAFLEAAEALAVQYIAYSSLIDAIYPIESRLVLIRDQSHKDLSDFIEVTIAQNAKELTRVSEDGGSEPNDLSGYSPLEIRYTNKNYHYHQKTSEEDHQKPIEEERGNVGWLEHTLAQTRTAREEFPPTDPKQRKGILNHLDNKDVISYVLSEVMKPQRFNTQFFEAQSRGEDKLIEPKDYAWIYACFEIYRNNSFSSTDLQAIFLSDKATQEFLPKTLWNRWCEISSIYWDAVDADDYIEYDNNKWVAKNKLKEKENFKELYELVKAKSPFIRESGDDPTVMDDAIVEVTSFYNEVDLRRKYKLKHNSQHFRLLGNALQFSSIPIRFRPINPRIHLEFK